MLLLAEYLLVVEQDPEPLLGDIRDFNVEVVVQACGFQSRVPRPASDAAEVSSREKEEEPIRTVAEERRARQISVRPTFDSSRRSTSEAVCCSVQSQGCPAAPKPPVAQVFIAQRYHPFPCCAESFGLKAP